MPEIAVITRTRDRSIFLKRALASIIRQKYGNLEWIIINDGGEKESVEKVKTEANEKGLTVRLIHTNVSKGMEAASNIGLNQSDSEFIAFHDDDDTWHPDFLLEAVNFLKSERGCLYGGVVTQTQKVLERLENDNIEELERTLYNPGLRIVYLAEMANGNCFTNNSFVFRRSLLEVVGLFDESLPVRGDWDFNLRFLMHADVGVIPKPLANWHHRVNGQGANANTVVGDNRNLHQEYDAIIRNKYLRADIKNGKPGLGLLLNLNQRGQIFARKKFKERLMARLRNLFNTFKGK